MFSFILEVFFQFTLYVDLFSYRFDIFYQVSENLFNNSVYLNAKLNFTW